MRFSVHGDDILMKHLNRLNKNEFDAVIKLNMAQIYNRGKQEGGTPVDTGELRQSLGISNRNGTWDVGYTKDYAPDVEYGHRTNGGGYVAGQHFLKRNVDQQRTQLLSDLQSVVKGR